MKTKIKAVLVESTHTEPIGAYLRRRGFVLRSQKPAVVISHGGDGTILLSEKLWPGIPKLILRGSQTCKKCSTLTNEEVIDKYLAGAYEIEEFHKIEARSGQKKIIGLNDIILHARDPRHAIRFHVWAGEKKLGHETIGDGVVVATPFGSSGYYRSITDSTFAVGVGIAFNNSTEQIDHVVVADKTKVRIKLLRGAGLIFADHGDDSFLLAPGAEVKIFLSRKKAKIIRVED